MDDMRKLVAVMAWVLVAPLAAQVDPTEEEIKLRTSDALEQCDTDDDGQIALAELQGRLLAFYEAFAEAGKDEEKQEAVRVLYPGLLTLQWFLAADLDDDLVAEEAELKWLYSHPHEEYHTLTESVWTLSDDDIEVLVDDFILRIRKGAKSHPHDRLRKKTGKGRNKVEKLVDQAQPYKWHVIQCVLAERTRSFIETRYSEAQLSKLFDKLGRKWTWGEGKEDDPFENVGEVVTAAEAERSEVDWIRAGAYARYAVGHKYEVPDRDKKYRVTAVVSQVEIEVKAGKLSCDYFELTCHGCSVKVWQHTTYPSLGVKREWNIAGGISTTQLTTFEE